MAFAFTMYWNALKKSALLAKGKYSPKQGLHRSRGTAGFSLIEAVLAVGIVAVAFVPLLGLMPIGLNTSRQAIDTTVEAEIVQQMTSQAQETNFSALTGLNSSSVVCFDGNGNITTSAAALYKAGFSVPTTPANPASSSMPGGTVLPNGTTTYQLATVSIYIVSTRTPSGMAAKTPSDLSASTAAKKYTVFVGNNGL